MSEKYDHFISDLIDLCKSHGVMLCSEGYETMQAWDWDGKGEVLYSGLDDRTKDQK